MKYDDMKWHRAAMIRRESRGAYLIEVDVGDEVFSDIRAFAASNLKAAKRRARSTARGPLRWEDQNLNPGELVFGYALRKYYRAQLKLPIVLEGEVAS